MRHQAKMHFILVFLTMSLVFSQEACDNKDAPVSPINTGDVAEMCQRVVDHLKKCTPKSKSEDELGASLATTFKLMDEYGV